MNSFLQISIEVVIKNQVLLFLFGQILVTKSIVALGYNFIKYLFIRGEL